MHCTLRVLRFFHFFKGIGYHALFRLICRFSSLCVLLQLSSALFKGTPDELGDDRLGPTVLVDVCPNLPTRRRVVPKSASCASWFFPRSKMVAHQFCHSYQLLSNLRLPVCLRTRRCACVSLAFMVFLRSFTRWATCRVPKLCPKTRCGTACVCCVSLHVPPAPPVSLQALPVRLLSLLPSLLLLPLLGVFFQSNSIQVFWQNVAGVLRHVPSH